jgi:uncharacterized protein (DUF2336 family)
MSHSDSLIAELDAVLGRASTAQRLDMLRRVVELFVKQADRYSPDHVGVFDDVISRLIDDKMERSSLIELAGKLASVDNAPANVVGRLSADNSIGVSRVMLENSKAIKEDTLVEIAKTKGHDHLAAIANRASLSAPVTDVLVERGGPELTRKIIANDKARISEMGFCKIINDASRDKDLAAAIAKRTDIPAELEPFLKQALG